MDRKRIGASLLALGVVMFVLSAIADPIGVGDGSGVGWKQVVGMVAGAAAIAIGAVWWRSGRHLPESTSVDV